MLLYSLHSLSLIYFVRSKQRSKLYTVCLPRKQRKIKENQILNQTVTLLYSVHSFSQQPNKKEENEYTWILCLFFSASERLARSATMRKRRRGFLTMDTAALHFRIASSDGFLFSTSKSFMNHFSIFIFLYLIFSFHNSFKREREKLKLYPKKFHNSYPFFKIEAGFVSATPK